MRQSGYYGGGIVGQINAQGFAERCMFARGYYKASRDAQPQNQPTATAYAPPPAAPPAVVAAPTAPVVTQPAPTPLVPNAPTVTRRRYFRQYPDPWRPIWRSDFIRRHELIRRQRYFRRRRNWL